MLHAKTRQAARRRDSAARRRPAQGGVPRALYPILQARLDVIQAERPEGLMLLRDWPDRAANRALPWPWENGDSSFMRHERKALVKAAGIGPEPNLTSVRHSGMSEGGDAELTDREILPQSRHASVRVLPRSTEKTMRQVQSSVRKRLASRPKTADVSGWLPADVSERIYAIDCKPL